MIVALVAPARTMKVNGSGHNLAQPFLVSTLAILHLMLVFQIYKVLCVRRVLQEIVLVGLREYNRVDANDCRVGN